jgi:hypothetical protein
VTGVADGVTSVGKGVTNTVGSVAGSFTRVGAHFGHAVSDAVSKPIEGLKKDGLSGFAAGTIDGVKGAVTHTGQGVLSFGDELGSGMSTTHGELTSLLDHVRGPGLQEFQQVLQMKPALRDTVRRLQPTMAGQRQSLQNLDDLFYLANYKKSKTIMQGIGGFMAFSVVISGYTRFLSGWMYLFAGSVVILAKSTYFGLFVGSVKSVQAVLGRPKTPFQGESWFENTRAPSNK